MICVRTKYKIGLVFKKKSKKNSAFYVPGSEGNNMNEKFNFWLITGTFRKFISRCENGTIVPKIVESFNSFCLWLFQPNFEVQRTIKRALALRAFLENYHESVAFSQHPLFYLIGFIHSSRDDLRSTQTSIHTSPVRGRKRSFCQTAAIICGRLLGKKEEQKERGKKAA